MDRLGLPDRALSRISGVDRGSIKNALAGSSRSSTYGRLERALDEIEEETGATDYVAALELADGTKVTFAGMTPEEAARAARAFLERTDDAKGVS